jgi:hypothetical protein
MQKWLENKGDISKNAGDYVKNIILFLKNKEKLIA